MTDGAEEAIVFEEPPAAAAAGASVLRGALATLPGSPGVYRMLDAKGDALYVGKARDINQRVSQYLQFNRLPHRLLRMVAETRALEIVSTHTEVEALLLESNLIKRLKPRYNVLLRDDKSFPYIALIEDHEFPQLAKHRGGRDRKGSYYGPFASAGAVNQTLTALQRAFLLRSCSDAVFSSRTRPCLLHQIKRCSAPCVGRIDAPGYAGLLAEAKDFLEGRSRE
ncbi:MAG: GIY-YIG nuclease family protein, partial [Tagaea sp.]